MAPPTNNNNSNTNIPPIPMPPPPNLMSGQITSSLKSGTASIILNKTNNTPQSQPVTQPIQLGQGIGSNTINASSASSSSSSDPGESSSFVKNIMHRVPIFHSRTKSFGGTTTTSSSLGTISAPNSARGSLKLDQPILTISTASPPTKETNTKTNGGNTTSVSTISASPTTQEKSSSGGSDLGPSLVKSVSSPSFKPLPPSLSNSTSTPNIASIDALTGGTGANYPQNTHSSSKHLAFTFTNFSNVPSVLMNHIVVHEKSQHQQEKTSSCNNKSKDDLSTIASDKSSTSISSGLSRSSSESTSLTSASSSSLSSSSATICATTSTSKSTDVATSSSTTTPQKSENAIPSSSSSSSSTSNTTSSTSANINASLPPTGFLEFKTRCVSFPCYEGSPLQQIGFLPSANQIQSGTQISHSSSNPSLTHSNSGTQLNTLAAGTPTGLTRSKSRDSGISASLADVNKNNMFWKNTPYDPHYVYKYNVAEVMTYISNCNNSGITNAANANTLLYHDIVIYYKDKYRNAMSMDAKTSSGDAKQQTPQKSSSNKTSSFPNSVFIKDLSMNGLIFHGTRIHTRHQKYDPVNVLTHLNYYLQLYNLKVQKNFSLFYNVYRLHYDPKTGLVSNASSTTTTSSTPNNNEIEEITLIAYPFVEYPFIDSTDEKYTDKVNSLPPRHATNVVAESLFHFIYLESKGTFVFEANEMYCYGSYLFGKFDCRIFDNGGIPNPQKNKGKTSPIEDPLASPQSKKTDSHSSSSSNNNSTSSSTTTGTASTTNSGNSSSSNTGNFSEYLEVKRFFSRHQCNDVCKELNLLKHPAQMDYYRQVEQSIFKFLNHHVVSTQQSFSNVETHESPSSIIPFVWRDPFNNLHKPKPSLTSQNSNNNNLSVTSAESVGVSPTTSNTLGFDFNKKQLPLTITYFQEQGKRNYMEDRIFFVNKSFDTFHSQRAAVLCVFDGHGGYECADFLHQNFIYHLECYQSLIFNIHEPIFSRRDLLEYAFVKIDEQYREKVVELNRSSASIKKNVPSPRTTSGITASAGSTGCTVFITASEEEHNTYYITCANVGDSRAFMIHQSKIIPLSSDHKPFYEQERKRIEMFGSRVENNRVCGLAVSRTFGDYYAKNNLDPTNPNAGINVGFTQPINLNANLRKQAVVALPEVVKHKIHLEKPKKVVEKRKDEKDGKEVITSTVIPSLPTLIVVASDGLFDVMSNSDVADYIYKQYYHHRVKDFSIIAKNLVNFCIYNRNSTDNVSVIISSLHYTPDH
ncbi:hypothetical protein C9374_012722 [Naegleria lovaniensis]|uniref:protein-serine/threonine phosphatase n=1 Tax=Naegleria lovaniensis TaxID=51637 RepID=A0AA88KWD0_NAELO|nr:uncharacterized protein C9374_012722 [Naegleria lovaniensis]KAG2392470.1 hypothetical protein C9374_012722 [Naegleria lovaniensis]